MEWKKKYRRETCYSDTLPHPLQWLQSPPQEDFPFFLSLQILLTAKPAASIKTASTTAVPIL